MPCKPLRDVAARCFEADSRSAKHQHKSNNPSQHHDEDTEQQSQLETLLAWIELDCLAKESTPQPQHGELGIKDWYNPEYKQGQLGCK